MLDYVYRGSFAITSIIRINRIFYLTGDSMSYVQCGMKHAKFGQLRLGAIRPMGWLKELLERNKAGRYWLHFAVRPSGNRRKVRMI